MQPDEHAAYAAFQYLRLQDLPPTARPPNRRRFLYENLAASGDWMPRELPTKHTSLHAKFCRWLPTNEVPARSSNSAVMRVLLRPRQRRRCGISFCGSSSARFRLTCGGGKPRWVCPVGRLLPLATLSRAFYVLGATVGCYEMRAE
jgi:hypothetical protein